jgi:hypothetical protein
MGTGPDANEAELCVAEEAGEWTMQSNSEGAEVSV